jgi:hypothetical protein
MDEQRVRLFLRFGGASERAALTALLRILHGVLIGDFGLRQPLQCRRRGARVHHDEHGGKSLVLLADQPASRAVVIHHAGGVAVDAHLVLDRTAGHRVARAERAIVVHQNFGTTNSEMPLLPESGASGVFASTSG